MCTLITIYAFTHHPESAGGVEEASDAGEGASRPAGKGPAGIQRAGRVAGSPRPKTSPLLRGPGYYDLRNKALTRTCFPLGQPSRDIRPCPIQGCPGSIREAKYCGGANQDGIMTPLPAWAVSSGGERLVDTEEVTSSILVPPTIRHFTHESAPLRYRGDLLNEVVYHLVRLG